MTSILARPAQMITSAREMWGRTDRACTYRYAAAFLGSQLLVWGTAIGVRSAMGAGVGALAAANPLWAASPRLVGYWLGFGLLLAGLLLGMRTSLPYRAAGVVLVALLARGLPLLVTGFPYGRDAYMHWGSVMLIANGGHLALTAPAYTYLSEPLLFSWAALLGKLAGLATVEQALPLLIGWELGTIALTALIGLAFCARLTDAPGLQVGGALAIAAASPFRFVTHFAPLSLAGLILWALWWLDTLPRSFGLALARVGLIFSLAMVHPFLPFLFYLLALAAGLVRQAGRRLLKTRGEDVQPQLSTPLALTLVASLAWQVYVAADFSLYPGTHLLEKFVQNILSLKAVESVQQNLSAPLPPVVSVTRWCLIVAFVLLAGVAVLLHWLRNRQVSVFLGCLAVSIFLTGLFGATGAFYMFVMRALPFVVPFAALVLVTSHPGPLLSKALLALVVATLPLSILTAHVDAPERVTLPADIAGLRYAAGLVRQDDVVLAEPELRGFKDDRVGRYFYPDSERWREQRVAQSTIVVTEEAARAFLVDNKMLGPYQGALDALQRAWTEVYTNGRISIYRRAAGGTP